MNWHDYHLAKLHHHDLINEAAELRLSYQVLSTRRPIVFYAPALARLGRWLIAWGWRLRARYGEVEFYSEVQHDWTR